MGVVLIFLVGVLVATVQVRVEHIQRGERARVFTLAALAAFFGGSLVKAIAQERLVDISFGSIAAAAATSALILYAWRQLSSKAQPATVSANSALSTTSRDDSRR